MDEWEEFVLIETFSKDKKISERKVSPDYYYNTECYETDDKNFIIQNNVTKSTVTNYRIGEEASIFYNGDGDIIKFVSVIKDELSIAEFHHKDNIFNHLDIVFNADNNSANAKLEYRLNVPQKNISVKCGLIYGDGFVGELFDVNMEKVSDIKKFKNINVRDLKACTLCADVFLAGNIIGELR
ncbi:MAG: hypothetical protein K2K44_12380 [Oscillospiraceae bacterium]|nr:hypothetical protein [Oscillospiraceae bacterium]